MNNRWVLGVALSALALGGGLATPPRTVCTGFLPKNDLKIPVDSIEAKGIDEAAFNLVLDKIEAVYGPVVAAKGATLVVNRKWADPTVNAYATQSGKKWYIDMYGGLARHKSVTSDGFMLVACHEIGHHLGGYPKSSGWATNEGGSDYFATLKCLRNVLGRQPLATVDPIAKAGCAQAFPGPKEQSLCELGAMAGVSASALLADLGQKPVPTLAKPDATLVSRTKDEHPAPQCRLDTYYQGALCVKPVEESLSNTAPGPGACAASDGYQVGVRPRCWFKPPANKPLMAKPRVLPIKEIDARLEALRQVLAGRGI